jgi:hypothetical protein
MLTGWRCAPCARVPVLTLTSWVGRVWVRSCGWSGKVWQRGRGERIETACAITSLLPERASAEELLAFWRGHWGIETRLHYVRDVTLGEDACRVRTGAAPQVLAAMRNTVVSLVRLAGHANVAAALRRFAARPTEALAAVGITYPPN